MKRVTTFAMSCLVTCVTALPAFADDPLGGLLGNLPIVGGLFGGSPPAGAPAPLLAAGIPAFIAIGGGALAIKLFRGRGKSEA